MSRVRRSCFLLFCLVVSGCSNGRYGLELAFDDTVDPATVRHIEVLVTEGRCPAPAALLVGVAPTGTIVGGVGLSQSQSNMLDALGDLSPGTYALYARGFDGSCQAIAAGCSVYSVERGRSGTLRVTLGATTPTEGCTGAGVCNDGACTRPDGGVDDGGVSVDACVSHPCGVDEYCVDIGGAAPDSEAGRTCAALTDCGPGQYEFTAPTATENRVCAACTECSGTQFASTQCANGNVPQNRVCTLLRTCGAGEYESIPPTATSDRACGQCHAACANCDGPNADDCVACPPDQYSNGVTCLPVSTCGSGQREQTPPSATTDRVCVACATCGAGEHATAQCANGNGPQDRICDACTTCSASQYETSACANGNGAQDRVCTSLTSCGAGQFQTVAPTATSDRACGTCLSCGPNQYQTTACANGNAAQDRVCAACSTCGAGEYASAMCSDGNGTQDRACTTCTTCNASQYETGACTLTSNRMCTATTNCTTGQYQSVAPTATSDRQCASCSTCPSGTTEIQTCANGNVAQNRTCSGTCTLTSIADGYTDTFSGSHATTGTATIRTQNDGATNVFNAFIRFNVAGGTCAEGGTIPGGATITGATLRLTMIADCPCTDAHAVHRVTGTWSEAALPAGVGPSVAGASSATFTAPGSPVTAIDITSAGLIADVQTHLSTPATDFGFRISKSGGTGSSQFEWGAREHGTAGFRPRLTITYTTN